MRMKAWLSRHRPSGVVTGFLTFFVVSYYVITKLDKSDSRVRLTKLLPEPEHIPISVSKVIRTKTNVIPMDILQEFAQDEENEKKTNYDFYDDSENYTSYLDEKGKGFMPMAKSSDKNNNTKLNISKSQNLQKVIAKPSGRRKANTRMSPQVGKNKHRYIHIFNVLEEKKSKQDSTKSLKCIEMKTIHVSSPICIHNPDDDEIISGKLSSEGVWEGNYVYIVGSVLIQNPSLEFLDLGCNIGVYTILAAKLGHRVVALDPNALNLRLLTKSLNMGGLTSKVTLLRNAISNVQENVTLFDIVGNIGGTFVETADENDQNDETIDSDHRAVAITLDDLADFFRDKPVFVKIDIETYELKALKGGNRFFSQVNVQFVLMEWIYHREFDTGKEVIKFMKQHGLYPHINAHRNTKLDPNFYRTWPDNVLWIKY